MSSPCPACNAAFFVRHTVTTHSGSWALNALVPFTVDTPTSAVTDLGAAEVSLAEGVEYDPIELVNPHWATFSDGWPLPSDEKDHCATIVTRGVSSHQ